MMGGLERATANYYRRMREINEYAESRIASLYRAQADAINMATQEYSEAMQRLNNAVSDRMQQISDAMQEAEPPKPEEPEESEQIVESGITQADKVDAAIAELLQSAEAQE